VSRTLIQIFLDTVERHSKPVQFLHKTAGVWRSVSAQSALDTVERLGLGLESLGVRRGDRVAILSETRLEWTLTDLAVLGLGAVTVPIYPSLTAPQCAALLRDSEARVVVASSAAQAAKLRALREELPALSAVVLMDRQNGSAAAAWEHAWDAVLARGARARSDDPSAFRKRAAAVEPDDLATLIYTSGTTGEPKGAMLTHSNIESNVRACLEVVEIGPHDVALSFLPLSHIFERMAGLYSMLAAGATIAYAESLEAVGDNATEVRPTVLNGVPRFYEKVHARIVGQVAHRPPFARALFAWAIERGRRRARAHFAGKRLGALDALQARLADRLVGAQIRERMGGRLRLCISGGAPLAPATLEFFFAIGIIVIEGYGPTETSPVICLSRVGQERPGSVGVPVPGVEVSIAPDGEILTRGPHVMQGYWRRPDATRAAIRDGWFHTGDGGRVDETGRLYITDRLKDVLVTAGGKKIAPQPIERALKETGWIAEAVLCGDRRPFVVALLAPDRAKLEHEAARRGWSASDYGVLLARPEVRALFEAEVARVNSGRASFEQIKKFDLLERDLTQESGELTPSLKVKRRVVLERYGSRVEALYGPSSVESAA